MLLKGVLLALYGAAVLMSENASILPGMVCQPKKVRVKLQERCKQTTKLALDIEKDGETLAYSDTRAIQTSASQLGEKLQAQGRTRATFFHEC